MKRAAERGILLLPVALVLAVVGALAYSMTREAGMGVSAVDAEYDTAVARYLAEGGMNLAKWQNEKLGCSNSRGFGSVALAGGTINASSSDITLDSGNRMTVAITASTPSGAAQRLERSKIIVHDLSGSGNEVKLGSSNATDTFIRDGVAAAQGDLGYMELTDGSAHGLVKFSSLNLPSDAMVAKAELMLYQYDAKSTQAQRALTAYRLTRDWNNNATWLSPWNDSPGGTYAPDPVATVAIGGNGPYALRIDSLVEGWNNDTINNRGVLLKPTGLLEARFASFENGSSGNRPQLLIRYYKRCT